MEKQKNCFLKGRNSIDPFSDTHMIRSENIYNKRQSVRHSYLNKEKIHVPLPAATIDLSCQQFENNTFTHSQLNNDARQKKSKHSIEANTYNYIVNGVSSTEPDENQNLSGNNENLVLVKI